GRGTLRPRRDPRRLHRSGHAAGFRLRPPPLGEAGRRGRGMSRPLLFPTSVVGSLPRPDYVKDLIGDEGARPPEEYRRLMGAAVRSAVALQECAGLDVVTDGEWWRKSYIGVIAELAHGFELSRNPADGRPWTVVVDRLSPKRPGFIAQEVAFLKQLTRR